MSLVINNLKKVYGKRTLIENFSFEFPKKGLVIIYGESGSGKTTLLNIIAGLDVNYDGEVLFNKTSIRSLKEEERDSYRIKNIGYIFQNFSLFDCETGLNNVILPYEALSNRSSFSKKKRGLELIDFLQLTGKENKNINLLSGGEKQRFSIARSIVNEPPILLCDEPTGALDLESSKIVLKFLNSIAKRSLVIVSTHDLALFENDASAILKLENKNISISNGNFAKNKSLFVLPPRGKISKKAKLPFSFQVKHSLHVMKTKKFRTALTNLMISLSLTGVGLSFLLSENLSSKIENSFSSILTSPQIVMKLKNNPGSPLGAVYPAARFQVDEIYEKYKEYLARTGTHYLVNFESIFTTENTCFVESPNKKFILNSFSLRNFNEYKKIQDKELQLIYPRVDTLREDQVVLGIPYVDMVNICYNLQIQRSYESLGNYLHLNDVFLRLSLANDDLFYWDETIFQIKGIINTKRPILYHFNDYWNEIVFDDFLGFNNDNHFLKNTFQDSKISFIECFEKSDIFLSDTFYNGDLHDFVFEKANSFYLPSICEENEECNDNRLFVYFVDKNSIELSKVKYISNTYDCLKNYYFLSNFGYSSFGSSFMSGFSKHVFLSKSDALIDYAVDAETSKSDEILELDLPEGIVQGYFAMSLNDGLQFSSNLENVSFGRKPLNDNEIVISSALAEKLTLKSPLGERLIFAGEANNLLGEDGRIEKTFAQNKLTIVGVKNNEKNLIYQTGDWTISFFKNQLSISSFNLIPTGVVFELNDSQNAEEIINDLSLSFPDYSFTNPIDEISKSLDGTLSFVTNMLNIFSFVTGIISIQLMCAIVLVTISESKKEISLLKYIGFNKNNTNSLFLTYSLIHNFSGYLISCFELFFIDIFMSLILDEVVKTKSGFSVNPKPYVIVFLIMIAMTIISSIVVLLLLRQNKASEKKHMKTRFFVKKTS